MEQIDNLFLSDLVELSKVSLNARIMLTCLIQNPDFSVKLDGLLFEKVEFLSDINEGRSKSPAAAEQAETDEQEESKREEEVETDEYSISDDIMGVGLENDQPTDSDDSSSSD